MQQEISSGTMLGIVLIALAAVIGLGFGVFSIAKGVANEGTVGVQDNLGTVSNSAFEDYNDKIVTGTMVQSAINNFKGKSVGILVNTTAMDKGVVTYKDHKHVNVWKYDGTAGNAKFTSIDNKSGGAAVGEKLTGAAAGRDHYYVNYNALLGNTGGTVGQTGLTFGDDCSLILKDGIYNSTGIPFAIDETGKVAFDYSVGGLTRSGNCEYLNATAKFDANLIKDETGTILGIVFTQRAQ